MPMHPVKQVSYKIKSDLDAQEHIKWCRRNLGERGVDWDFSGYKILNIAMYSSKAVVIYSLVWD